ncbi:MAG TPA: hypothetical protein VJ739_17890, partial [Gemmataceae bacterium]|nr:hypothetical protein [Gemmataceae bacterium]
GDLTTANAALLFSAPLLAWLPELLPARRAGPRTRAAARLALALLPVVLAVGLAAQKFRADSLSPGHDEPSVEDHTSFGK